MRARLDKRRASSGLLEGAARAVVAKSTLLRREIENFMVKMNAVDAVDAVKNVNCFGRKCKQEDSKRSRSPR